jgi:hypothetical protein
VLSKAGVKDALRCYTLGFIARGRAWLIDYYTYQAQK